MSPGLITSLSAMIVTALTTYLGGIGWFAAHPDVIHFLAQAVEPALMALLAGGTAFMSGSAWWENFNRIVFSVIAVVEAERGGQSNAEARADAINRIIALIPESALGWRGAILRIPGIRSWIVGFILDRVVSATKKALKANTTDKNELRSAVKSAVNRTNGGFTCLAPLAVCAALFVATSAFAADQAEQTPYVEITDATLTADMPLTCGECIVRFDFEFQNETSFSAPARWLGGGRFHASGLGEVLRLKEGTNRIEHRAVSNKGRRGPVSVWELLFVPPEPPFVPPAFSVEGFRGILPAVDDGPLE